MSTHTLEPKIAIGSATTAPATPASPPAETTKSQTSSLVANLRTAVLITLATTVIFGLFYPLAVTAVAQLFFPRQANGSLITQNNQIVGSELIGQTFSGPGYFHSRPSAAGAGYDAANSSGSNLAPTNHQLLDRIKSDSAKLQTRRFPSISSPLPALASTPKSPPPPPNSKSRASLASATSLNPQFVNSSPNTRSLANSASSANPASASSNSISSWTRLARYQNSSHSPQDAKRASCATRVSSNGEPRRFRKDRCSLTRAFMFSHLL
jgi:hypothetical protein